MIRDRHRDRRAIGNQLHDDMAAASPRFDKTVTLKDTTNLAPAQHG
jgi:hypothetical protein